MFVLFLIFHANVRGVESLAAEPRMGNGIPTTTSGSMESLFQSRTSVVEGTVKPWSLRVKTWRCARTSRNARVAVRRALTPKRAVVGSTHSISRSAVSAATKLMNTSRKAACVTFAPRPFRLLRRVLSASIHEAALAASRSNSIVKQTPTFHI